MHRSALLDLMLKYAYSDVRLAEFSEFSLLPSKYDYDCSHTKRSDVMDQSAANKLTKKKTKTCPAPKAKYPIKQTR